MNRQLYKTALSLVLSLPCTRAHALAASTEARESEVAAVKLQFLRFFRGEKKRHKIWTPAL